MWELTRQISFCAGHRLVNYSGPCANVHGHNFVAEVSVRSNGATSTGMVIDFFDLDKKVKTWIDQWWDHGFLVNQFDEKMRDFLGAGQQKKFVLDVALMESLYEQGPDDLYCIEGFRKDTREYQVAMCNPTVENLSLVLHSEVVELLDFNEEDVKVRLYESSKGWCTV